MFLPPTEKQMSDFHEKLEDKQPQPKHPLKVAETIKLESAVNAIMNPTRDSKILDFL